MHRQRQGPCALRVRREGLHRHHQRAAPGGLFVVGARALPGNPYDGDTLAAQIAQTERITGVAVERAYVDRGCRGHDSQRHRVFISRQKRGITSTIHRELRRRNAVEPLIGHMKSDGHLDHNFLLGPDGDAINAVLAQPDTTSGPSAGGWSISSPSSSPRSWQDTELKQTAR